MGDLSDANSSSSIEVLGGESGIQTYLNCTITRDSLRVVSYLSLKICSN